MSFDYAELPWFEIRPYILQQVPLVEIMVLFFPAGVSGMERSARHLSSVVWKVQICNIQVHNKSFVRLLGTFPDSSHMFDGHGG